MSDVRSEPNTLIEYDASEKISTAYTISDLMTISLAYHSILDDPQEKELAKRQLWAIVNKWLELVSPLKYIPGLVDEVADNLKSKLWEGGENLTDVLIEKIIVYSVVFKEKIYGLDYEILEALTTLYGTLVYELLKSLGGKVIENTRTWKILFEPYDPEEKLLDQITLAATILVLSTNP